MNTLKESERLGKLCHQCYFRPMTTMNISLSEELRSFVDSQVSGGDYISSSEYVREVLRKEKDRVRLREMLLEGMESPLMDEPMDAAYFDKFRKRIAEKK